MCKRFKTVLYIGKANPLDNRSDPAYKPQYIFEFSKNKIYFTDSALKFAGAIGSTIHPSNGKNGIRHTDRYELIKLEDDDVDRMKGSKFKVKLQSGVAFNIKSGGLEGIKMRWIHERYSIQRHWEWYWKTIFTLLFGAIITYYFTKTSYKQGYKDGLIEGRNSQLVPNPSPNSIPNNNQKEGEGGR